MKLGELAIFKGSLLDNVEFLADIYNTGAAEGHQH